MKNETALSYEELLRLAQAYCTKTYSALFHSPEHRELLPGYLAKFLRDGGYRAEGMDEATLLSRLYDDMARFSVLTPYLEREDVEEININAWDDVAVTYLDGHTEKCAEHFLSPMQATDTVKRLLQEGGMTLDNACPVAMGHLNQRVRVTAVKEPVVDGEVGVAASIRILHPQTIDAERLIETDFAEREMMDFLAFCLHYRLSLVAAGVTSSGKTTLLNALLSEIPDEKRILTIETGSRELSLVKKRGGKTLNNVVHTLTRPSDNPTYDISQEDLLAVALRFHPDVICVGEMRDTECYAAVQATQTGHTVISSVHARTAEETHRRIALLCEQRMPMSFEIALMLAVEAFPIVVTTNLMDNHERKITAITECRVDRHGELKYRTLWAYEITRTESGTDGRVRVTGGFHKVHAMSDALRSRFLQAGAPMNCLENFMRMEEQET